MTTQKIAFITGANKGIGYEVARQLSGQEFTVLLGARDPERGEAAASKLRSDGGDVRFVAIDVGNEGSIAQAVQTVRQQWGQVDVLINNAGANYEFSSGARPSALGLDVIKATFETNFFGAFAVIQHFLPLLQQSESARIINVSSTLGSLTSLSDPANPYYGINTIAYNSSKTALNALTVSLAKDLKAEGISVNSICPGWVQTDMGTAAAPRTVEQGASIIVKLATIPESPTGKFMDDAGEVRW
jgi:NAD(P)-dependent dehydrogenase (short-subunit alcohol dehydrogenase family)